MLSSLFSFPTTVLSFAPLFSYILDNSLILIIGVLVFGFILTLAPGSVFDDYPLLCLQISLFALFIGTFACLSFNQSATGFQFV